MRLNSATFAVALAFPAFLAAESKSSIAWRNYSDAAWKEARESGKPLLVEAWGDWCPPCRRMDEEVWSRPEVIEATRKFVCVSMRVDRTGLTPDQRGSLGVRGLPLSAFPTIAILDPWREMLTMNEGYMYAPDLVSLLRLIPPDYNSIRAYREALENNRDNSRALAALGSFYQRNSSLSLATRYYQEALKTSGVKEDLRLREDLMLEIGGVEIQRRDWKAARVALDRFRKECPKSVRSDEALLALVVVDLRQGKLSDAGKRVDELKTRYPQSRATPQAERLLAQAKAAPAKP